MALALAKENETRFSQPFRQFLFMFIALGLVVVIAYLLVPTVAPVFLSSPYLNGLILAVFVFGVIACFWQLYMLIRSVSWIEGFALDRPGHEFVSVPRLLLPLAALLSDTRARRGLTSSSARTILDSVAQRLDEARDITRYIVNLLIFLGLLGTFYGLATTVPAVVETIRSLEPDEANGGGIDFARLMEGLEDQLGGMGTAFASSLLGLAGSLVVGLLELFAGHGQNRFYMELEEWLSTITRIGLTSNNEGGGGSGADVTGAVEMLAEQNALQLDAMRELFTKAELQRADTDAKLAALTEAVSALTENVKSGTSSGMDPAVMTRLAAGQESLAAALGNFDSDAAAGIDTETRARMRSIDLHLLRVLEEMSAGRQDSVAEIRAELAALTQVIRDRTGG